MVPVFIPYSSQKLSKSFRDDMKAKNVEGVKIPIPRKKDAPAPFIHEIDSNRFKRGIVQPENSGNFKYTSMNPRSSATGAYQILYKEHADELRKDYGINNRDEFALSNTAQEKIMDARIKRYEKDAYELYNEYKPQLKNKFTFSEEEIMALVHFAGRQGTRKYLASIRDDKPAPRMPGTNLTQKEYLKRFNKGMEAYDSL